MTGGEYFAFTLGYNGAATIVQSTALGVSWVVPGGEDGSSASDDDLPYDDATTQPEQPKLKCSPGRGGASGQVIGCMDVFGFPLPDYSNWCGYSYSTPGCGGATLDSYGGGPGLIVFDYFKQAAPSPDAVPQRRL